MPIPTPDEALTITDADRAYADAQETRSVVTMRVRTTREVMIEFPDATFGALEEIKRRGRVARWHVYDGPAAGVLRFVQP